MKQDDIEKILQQYGEDKRQQQHIADNLHRMARRQSQRRIGIAGVAVLLLCVTLTIRLLSPRHTDVPTTASTQKVSVPKTDSIVYPSINNTPSYTSTPAYSKPRMNGTSTELYKLPTDDNAVADSHQPDAIHNPDDTAKQQNSDTEILSTDIEKNIIEHSASLQELFAEQTNTVTIPNNINNITSHPEVNAKRISFISSINASALSNGSIGYAEGIMTNDMTFNAGESFSSINPDFTLSANVGASYAIASIRNSRLDVGLSFSGHLQQGTISDYTVGLEADNLVNTDEIQYVLSNQEHSYNSFDLFANIPITLNFFPLGKDKTGWSVNITPAHSIVRSHTLGASSANPFVVNPWKLNVGLGIVLPRKVIRRVAITANLLPLYTSRSIHEIGFEIGF